MFWTGHGCKRPKKRDDLRKLIEISNSISSARVFVAATVSVASCYCVFFPHDHVSSALRPTLNSLVFLLSTPSSWRWPRKDWKENRRLKRSKKRSPKWSCPSCDGRTNRSPKRYGLRRALSSCFWTVKLKRLLFAVRLDQTCLSLFVPRIRFKLERSMITVDFTSLCLIHY